LSSLIAFNDITVEQVLGFEDSEESKENKGGSFASSTVNLPSKIKLYKVGSNDESYIFNPRDHIFMQGIRQILEFLHDIKTNAQSQVNQTLITRSYQDLSDEMLEKIFHRYHQADYFRAQPTSMFHQFVMSYGEKQKGLSTYQQWITDAINNNKLIIDEHFIDQPAFIQQHSTLRLFRDLNNVFTDGFGFIQLVDNNQNLKNGTYAFQITDDFKYLELYPVTLITYIHSNVKPFLLYDARHYTTDVSIVRIDLQEILPTDVELTKDYQLQQIDSNENAVEFWVSNINHPALTTTLLAEEIIVQQSAFEEQLYPVPKHIISLLDTEEEDYPSLRNLTPNLTVSLTWPNGDKISLRGFAYVHMLVDYFNRKE
jgi:hypothetical protein